MTIAEIEARIALMDHHDGMAVAGMIADIPDDERPERRRLSHVWARRALAIGLRTGPDGPYEANDPAADRRALDEAEGR